MTPDRRDLPRIPELDEDYELVRELGRGGSAIVYLARERELGRDVAVKLIRPGHLGDEEAVARLVREARTVGQLQHPNLVMLLGTRRLGDDGLALILQFVPGRTLRERLEEEGPLPFPEVTRILEDLGRALAYAHRRRIVHRDLKPENVYLDDDAGVAKLADFGIARAWDSDSGLTMPGTALGTPTYMSPEQVDGGKLDGRSDLYGLGLVGWEMVTGRRPWDGESLYSVIYKQKHESLPDMATLRDGVPRHLQRAVEGSLAKAPADRWRNAEEFLSALAGKTGGEPRVTRGRADAMGGDEAGASVGGDPPGSAGAGAPGAAPLPSGRGALPVSSEGRGVDRGFPGAHEHEEEDLPYDVDLEPAEGRRSPAWALVAVVLVLAGGFAATAYLADGGAEMRSVLGQILPASMTPGGADSFGEEPYGTWRPEGEGTDPRGAGEDGTEGGSASGSPGGTDDAGLDAGDPGAAASAVRLEPLGGTEMEGVAGQALEDPVVITVEGADGEVLAGVPVVFAVTQGGGRVDAGRRTTDSEGRATVRWTLGAESGEQRLFASVEGRPEVTTSVAAVARRLSPGRLVTAAEQNREAEVRQPVPGGLRVRVVADDGTGIGGEWVRFQVLSGDGEATPDSVRTDPDGFAEAAWVLGPTEGIQEARAEVAGSEGSLRALFVADATPARLGAVSSVATGGTHTCLLEGGGQLRCWGDNAAGQLGTGGARRSRPGPPTEGGDWRRLTSGLAHACALDLYGEAFCWGANESGQLGDGTTAPRSIPRPVEGDERFVEIQAGASHTCARTREDRVLCWGANTDGQLGDGTTDPRTRPTRVTGDVRFRQLAVGWRHTCALDGGGAAYCWGTNTAGELGRSTMDRFAAPSRVAGGRAFSQISSGNAHTCGITTDGAAFCWGDNSAGQLGDGTTEARRVPTPVASEVAFVAITAGAVHTCALAENGGAHCWGRNIYGQVGDGTSTDRTRPVPVEGSFRFDRLHAFGSHTCGRVPAGDLLCWGYNAEGQLGDGTRTNRQTPVSASAGSG